MSHKWKLISIHDTIYIYKCAECDLYERVGRHSRVIYSRYTNNPFTDYIETDIDCLEVKLKHLL